MFQRLRGDGKVFTVLVERSEGSDDRFSVNIGLVAWTPHNVLLELKRQPGVAESYPWLFNANTRRVHVFRGQLYFPVKLLFRLNKDDMIRFTEHVVTNRRLRDYLMELLIG